MKLIDGKEIAKQLKEEIKIEVAEILDSGVDGPHLAAILVGNDPASETYVASKEKACKNAGILSSVYRYPSNISEKELLEAIDFINSDPEINGLLVQMPLPKHISEDKVIEHINPEKDVDGFHPLNLGKMVMNKATFIPATPYGIVQLLERSKIETQGKHVVVLGRSNIVGTPISILLSRKSKNANATVTLCHSRTQNLKEICLQADILIAAIGQPEFLKEDMVKEGAVVIDVGIHRIESASSPKGYVIKGDVAFDEVSKKASWISPVPGGVGPMTIASLLRNTLMAYKAQQKH